MKIIQFKTIILLVEVPIDENVIEHFSHRDDRASRIVFVFVVGDSDNKAKHRARITCTCAWTQPRANARPRPQSFTDSLVRSTPVRRLYASSNVDCFS